MWVTKMFNYLQGLLRRPNLKILAIADLHDIISDEALDIISKQKYDICILLGDVGSRALKSLCTVLDTSITYGVLGNHDSFELYENFGIKQLDFDTTEIITKNRKAIRIKGLSGSSRYKNGNYPMLTQEESEAICTHEKGDCDILFSHDFPYNFYSQNSSFYSSHSGLKGINKYLQSASCPKLLLHGHLHKNTKRIYDRGCGYKKKGSPIVIGVYGCTIINYKTLKIKMLFLP